MKKYLVAVALLLVSMPILAMAQTPVLGVTADIPFSFTANGIQLPAGNYRFDLNNQLETVTVASQAGTQTVLDPVLTRLSPRQENEAAVVFDVVGKDHYLSEVYVPGLDGFQFKGAPAMHTHVRIKGK